MAFDPQSHLVTIKGGAKYLPVKDRVVWFREVHPDGVIDTQVIFADYDKGLYVVRAEVRIPDGGSATGHKSETTRDFPAGAMEKAETGAIGRALAALGYGTANSLDFDEGDRVADSPVDSRRTGTPSRNESSANNLRVVKSAPTTTTAPPPAKAPADPAAEAEAVNKGLLRARLAPLGHEIAGGWPAIVKVGHEHFGMEELTVEQVRDDEHRRQWLAILVDKLPVTAEEQETANIVEHYTGRIEAATTARAVTDIMAEARKGAGLEKDQLAHLAEAVNNRLAALKRSS